MAVGSVNGAAELQTWGRKMAVGSVNGAADYRPGGAKWHFGL